jgi:hypothetical protein
MSKSRSSSSEPHRQAKNMNSAPPIPITKGRTIARWVASAAFAMSASGLLLSCATPGETKKQEALVCPQCRMVEVRSAFVRSHGRYPGFPHRTASGPIYHGTTYEHRCESCQGVLTTLFREGKFQHQCSICKETPFTCPVVHPKTARL